MTLKEYWESEYGKIPGNVIALVVNGQEYDLNFCVPKDFCIHTIEPITLDSDKGLEILRHSTSHVLAQAVLSIYPDAKYAIGPAVDNGFYYDFDLPDTLSENKLKLIEKKMSQLIKASLDFKRVELPKREARDLFAKNNQLYKVELIDEIPDDIVSVYWQGDFVDLCRGPHIPNTKYIKAFKLLSVAGAYWRGSEKNKMLQRIYGTAFDTKEKLKKYLEFIEEQKKRDHRKLGKELELFSFSPDIGAGLPIYLPKGAILRSILEDFEKKEHLKRGYQLLYGPHILRLDLWKKSGHYENYREFMYFTEIEGEQYAIKPMNCIAHIYAYKSKIRSYRDLPIRYFEMGTVYRHEKSGVLHGLLRVRGFTQDDAHVFCTPTQLKKEIKEIIDFVSFVMDRFHFDFKVEISTKPEKYIGEDSIWEMATNILVEVLEELDIPFGICEGEGAFYGPKIDIKLKDAIGRLWQCATIQCDFNLPERFDLKYVDKDGIHKRPVMLHRVVLGALDRFIAILIEHYAGNFPLWLSPVQVRVMTIADRHIRYAESVFDRFTDAGFRVDKDFRNEKIGLKIRECENEKIPYSLIIGDKEQEKHTISVRKHTVGNIGVKTIDDFLNNLKREILNFE